MQYLPKMWCFQSRLEPARRNDKPKQRLSAPRVHDADSASHFDLCMRHPARNRWLYSILRAVLLATVGCVACVALCASWTVAARAETAPDTTVSSTEWLLHVDGSPADWPLAESPDASPSEAERVAEQVLQTFRQDGFYDARLDSVAVDSIMADQERTDATIEPTSPDVTLLVRVTLFVRRGPRVTWGGLRSKAIRCFRKTGFETCCVFRRGSLCVARRWKLELRTFCQNMRRKGTHWRVFEFSDSILTVRGQILCFGLDYGWKREPRSGSSVLRCRKEVGPRHGLSREWPD